MNQKLFRALFAATSALAAEPPAADNGALRLVAKIPVPEMTGTWDHIGADGAGGRLFGNAQDIHALEVIDLRSQRVVRAVTGPFNRNQGIVFLPDLKKIVISNGRSGLCVVLNSETLEPGKSIGIGLGADLMAYDSATKLLYVDHGGRDSNRGFGAVAVIDLVKEELVADIPTDLRPAAMAIESHGPRLFVCVPNANQIAVIDRPTQKISARFDITGTQKPVSITLDEARHRLFVLTRTPAKLVVLDSDTGKTVAALDGGGEAEDVSFDAVHHRIYTTGLDGVVFVYQQASADHYEIIARIPTKPHAGTSVWIPEMNRFCVAVAQHEKDAPEIWVYEPVP
jgi:DNA-binding beta-propeller fold protein YncE